MNESKIRRERRVRVKGSERPQWRGTADTRNREREREREREKERERECDSERVTVREGGVDDQCYYACMLMMMMIMMMRKMKWKITMLKE